MILRKINQTVPTLEITQYTQTPSRRLFNDGKCEKGSMTFDKESPAINKWSLCGSFSVQTTEVRCDVYDETYAISLLCRGNLVPYPFIAWQRAYDSMTLLVDNMDGFLEELNRLSSLGSTAGQVA